MHIDPWLQRFWDFRVKSRWTLHDLEIKTWGNCVSTHHGWSSQPKLRNLEDRSLLNKLDELSAGVFFGTSRGARSETEHPQQQEVEHEGHVQLSNLKFEILSNWRMIFAVEPYISHVPLTCLLQHVIAHCYRRRDPVDSSRNHSGKPSLGRSVWA